MKVITPINKPRQATPREVAEQYSVTVPTVFNWVDKKIIHPKIAVGRVYRFDLEEVEAELVAETKKQAATKSQTAG